MARKSKFACGGLEFAPKFLLKVRACPEIATQKLGILPPRGGAQKIARGEGPKAIFGAPTRQKPKLICQNFGAGFNFLLKFRGNPNPEQAN